MSDSDLQKITDYVKANAVPVKDGRKCIDGRYQKDLVTTGMLARPGADAGYVEILLALKKQGKLIYSVDEIVSKVKEALSAMGEEFYAHTDHHADNEQETPSIGCGHLAKASKEDLAESYGVDSKDMQEAIKELKRMVTTDQVSMDVLEGDHKEQGVLVIDNLGMTVNSQNGDQMYFIYDVERDRDFMQRLFNELQIGTVTFEEFKEVSDKQLEATLNNLAKGMPVYMITFEGNEPKVEYLRTI